MTSEQLSSPSGARPRFQLTVRTGIWICVIIGILVSGYLSYVKLTEVPMICMANGVFDCATVQSSIYSRIAGIPIAWLGLGMYILLAAILLLESRVSFFKNNGTMLFFGICLFGWVYSMYLVYLQVVVLGALCQWCLTHEVNMTVLFLLVSRQMWRELNGDD